MFNYTRRDSMSGVLLEMSLPTLDTVIHNSRVLFAKHKIVQWFSTIHVY